MVHKLLNVVENQNKDLLSVAMDSEDFRVLVRWLKILSSMFYNKYKSKKIDPSIEYIMQLIETFTNKLLGVIDEDIMISHGPQLFEVFSKVEGCLVDYESLINDNNHNTIKSEDLSPKVRSLIDSLT